MISTKKISSKHLSQNMFEKVQTSLENCLILIYNNNNIASFVTIDKVFFHSKEQVYWYNISSNQTAGSGEIQ